MPHIAFLIWIRRLFTVPGPDLDVIADAFVQSPPKHPAQPMSDQELTRTIREFQDMSRSATSPRTLGHRFAGPKPEH